MIDVEEKVVGSKQKQLTMIRRILHVRKIKKDRSP
tara:strand:- start:268 stop:372 length:105 start_codon:yes stop_codon:yes gene_type:complete